MQGGDYYISDLENSLREHNDVLLLKINRSGFVNCLDGKRLQKMGKCLGTT